MSLGAVGQRLLEGKEKMVRIFKCFSLSRRATKGGRRRRLVGH